LVSIFALFKEFVNPDPKGFLNRENYECFGPNYIEEIKKEFKGIDMDLETKKDELTGEEYFLDIHEYNSQF
jgi:hypothetical protein